MSRVLLRVCADGGGAAGLLDECDPTALVPLRHGEDPRAALAAVGWHDPRWLGASRPAGEPETVEIEVAARRGEVTPFVPAVAPLDAGLDLAPGEEVVPHQRVAAYAVVVEGGALLLTQLSSRVHAAPGRWTLPGGGLDPGEDPVAGLVREVWEESGQDAEIGGLLDVQTQHWVGRAPSGALEDFHAVRLVYRARVAAPSAPVVHDVGGSTADARWVPLDEIDALRLVPTVLLLREAGHLGDTPGP
ncbi:NUDIX hydrolase [Janibacter melonis]|uniref:NUDIX hydrolase n=1 Tax=Janibacter melonis TaxID=262209 RepID=UPI00191910F2|nr:NUDIX hydrolase [Janibacter melonis]